MIKMKYKGYLAGLAFLSFLTGCDKDFLERPPKASIVDANYYQTAEQVIASTAPLYNVVWFAYNDKASHGIGDARGGLLYSGSYQEDNIRMNTTGITPENGSSWRAFYNVVGQANTAITNINRYAPETVSQDVKNMAIGEARFMRGVAYSYLTQNWKEVPIIANNETVLTDTTIARNTEESIWEFIIRDIRYATKVLPEASIQPGRLTKWSAEGMLAKMFLTRAGVGMNGSRRLSDLDSAAYYAKRVIDNSGKTLVPEYKDLFIEANNHGTVNPSESLFSLIWKYDGDWGAQNSVQAFLAYGSSLTSFGDGWGGDIGASLWALNQYEDLNEDERRKATYMLPGDNYDYIHEIVDGETVPLHVRTDNNDQADYRSRAHVKKYVIGLPSDNGGRVQQQRTEINTYMLRLADVYLIYAEAILDQNPAEALQYFNMVHQRAGLPAKTSITWDDIFKERIVEFAMEGQAWYEFTRLHYYNPQRAYQILSSQDRGLFWIYPNNKANATSWELEPRPMALTRTVTVNESNFYLPIPATELSRAPNLRKPAVPYQFDGE
jgi:hypothetical protein